MKSNNHKHLIIGIGNVGRQDDGLGWIFLDVIKETLSDNFDCEYRYQLQIEDAELISTFDSVYFVDAHKDHFDQGFTLKECFPRSNGGFNTHHLAPETVLFIAKKLYNAEPQSYILGISGEQFKLQIGLTEIAQNNLSKAVTVFCQHLAFHNKINTYLCISAH